MSVARTLKVFTTQAGTRGHCVRLTTRYSTVQYSTVQYRTVQYSTVQYSTDKRTLC